MELVFATNNRHKLSEIAAMLDGRFTVLGLADIGCSEEIPEEGNTLEDNASQKARYVHDKYGYDCFADDTGLEVEALGGEPGVYSARYAGEGRSYEDNNQKLLGKLAEINNRRARFRTVISLIIGGREVLFEGVAEGEILTAGRGTAGFGYDPVFRPAESNLSFAEMPAEEKNRISHRGKAFVKMVNYLLQQAELPPEEKG